MTKQLKSYLGDKVISWSITVRFNGWTLKVKEMTFLFLTKNYSYNSCTKNNIGIKIVSLTVHIGYKKLSVF